MMVKTKRQLVPKHLIDRVSASGTNGKKYITVHDTGNKGIGADAQAHANIQSNGNPRIAGWHWQVDDKIAIQSFLHTVKAYHAGDGAYGTGNNDSLGVELCINADGVYLQTLQNGAELIAWMMKEENIPLGNVVQHNYWSGKNCPRQIRNGRAGVNWSKFKQMIKAAFEGDKMLEPTSADDGTSVAGARLVKEENAYFLATEDIKVRSLPTTQATHTGTLPEGASIEYFKVYEGNGYRWLQYVGYTGNTLYVPYRPINDIDNQWGTFHSERPTEPSKKTSEPKNVTNYSGGSIVDYLDLSGNSHLGGSSFENRKRLAEQHGISNYRGTAAQNRELLNKLQGDSGSSNNFDVQVLADKIERTDITGVKNRADYLGLTVEQYKPVQEELNRRYS